MASQAAQAEKKALQKKRQERRTSYKSKLLKNWDLYLLLLPALIYFVVFKYWPMYGLQIAFRKYVAADGIMGSAWVGLDNFKRFFDSYQFTQTIRNTLNISLLGLVLSFPAPIILAILINQVEFKPFKKSVQTVTYMPHFISTVVMVGLLNIFLSPNSGPINALLKQMGFNTVNFMGEPKMFSWIYVLSGMWQSTGYNAIIYIASLAGISPEYYEAAQIDGASKFKRIIYIDLPFLAPTASMLFILNAGRIMSVGYEKVFLMQNSLNLSASEIISTYVYKVGLLQMDFSYSTAIGLFNTVINLIIIVSVNGITRKINADNSLW